MIVLRDPAGSAQRDQVRDMLRTICPEGDVQVNDDGSVFMRNGEPCADPENVSCRCLCVLLSFDPLTVGITVNPNLRHASGGLTRPGAPPAGGPPGRRAIDDATLQPDGSRGPGVSPEVEIEPGDNYEAARADDPAQFVDEPDWLILAHELCGHALHMMRGDETRAAPQDPPVLPYPDNHRQATDAGARIREHRGLPAIDQESVRHK